MDIFAHASYGATLLARSGLAGGRTGLKGRRWYSDSSVWWSVFFSLLPDMVSMWTAFSFFYATGVRGNYFHVYSGNWLVLYRYAHSLITAGIVAGLILYFRRPLFFPSLSMGLHVLCDVVSHGGGKFQTMPFYPFSGWGMEGIPFWANAWFVAVYWGILVLLWCFLIIWRRVPGVGSIAH